MDENNSPMQRFDIITEADARVLPRGETVTLARGGHITPLAADTLKERRVRIVHEGSAAVDDLSLAPQADIRSIAVGSDHTGVALRRSLVAFLRGRGLTVNDIGTGEAAGQAEAGREVSVDYPDVAAAVATAVARGEADAGIVIDGAGIGSAIAANKIKGVRAAVCHDTTTARYARQHNGANVLSLGATLVSTEQALDVVNVWMNTAMN